MGVLTASPAPGCPTPPGAPPEMRPRDAGSVRPAYLGGRYRRPPASAPEAESGFFRFIPLLQGNQLFVNVAGILHQAQRHIQILSYLSGRIQDCLFAIKIEFPYSSAA